ncbi:MAG: alpha/beta fold hydrolase [Bryobacteraceae bacterium]
MKLPILFLHGVTRCARSFDPLLPLLSFQRQAQAIDFSGHGDAPRRRGAYKVTDYVSDVAPLLERPTILYGHSMGAMVAALVARNSRIWYPL